MVNRFSSAALAQSPKSVLLLGPRQVGKSTLIKSLNPELEINLSDEMDYLTYSSNPAELRRRVELEKPRSVFIDEVQRLPSILNTVQSLIDQNKKLKFYLTGSSARKLRRGQANLLPGRIFDFKMGPLICGELNFKLDIQKALRYGTLPEVYLSDHAQFSQKLLRSYVATYLREEIKAEALVRQLDSFARFLSETMSCVGRFVDFSKLARQAKISRHAVPRYFEILEDTMIGYRLGPFPELAEKLDLIRHPKFYLFDIGIYNSFMNNFEPSPDRIGPLAEQLVFNQLLHSAWALDREIEIFSFKTRAGLEVDFVIRLDSQVYAIEVKASDRVSSEDAQNLIEFSRSFPKAKGLFLVHMGTREQKLGPVSSLPLNKAIAEIFR